MAGTARVVLSIDGGGIRGIVPACILQELVKRLKAKRSNKRLHEYFDLITGTSTGGIIAAGLAAPARDKPKTPASDPERLIELYRAKGADIFSRDTFSRLREALMDPRSLWQEKYDASELEAELQAILGMARLSEGLTNVMLTAYDIERRETAFMKNTAKVGGGQRDDYYFWQAARATAAAPTYFEPARVRNLTRDRTETLVDGGVFNNDPALSAYVEARKIGFAADDIHVVSLGTGSQTRPFRFEQVRNWGPLGWMNPSNSVPILSLMMHGQAHAAGRHLEELLGKRYYRFDGELEFANDDMDDASAGNIRNLMAFAELIVKRHSARLDDVVALLTTK